MLAVQPLPLSSRDIDIINKKTLVSLKKDTTIPVDVLKECFTLVVENATPKACYVSAPIEIEGDVIFMLGEKTVSKVLARHLRHAKQVYLFAVTLGIGIDRLISKYSAVSTAKSYVIDRIASQHVESVCDYVCQYIEDKTGKNLTARFSAGYGDYSIEYQQFFVDMLDTNRKIGLTMTSGGMLTPSKSVTAIVGLCDAPQEHGYCCDNCARCCKDGGCVR